MSDDWLHDRLSGILQFPVPQDMIDYISSITNVRDLEDYMGTLLDFTNPQHTKFFQELLQRRKASSGVGYKKHEVEEVYIAPKNEKKKKEKGSKTDNSNLINQAKKESPEPQAQNNTKKKKYVNLYSQEGRNRDIVLLKGRHKCDCQARKHRLISNCLKCGRIVCAQEGSGPCFFCGSLVCSREENEVISSGNKQSNHLLQRLMEQKGPGYEAAIEQRNRLLEYDRNRSPSFPHSHPSDLHILEIEKRTQVIDDESDYFSTNSTWNTPAERELLKKKEAEMHARKHQSRRDMKVTLDIGLKKMVEAKPTEEYDMYQMDEILREITNSVKSPDREFYEPDQIDPSSEVHPKYVEDNYYERPNYCVPYGVPNSSKTKIQDREYLEMVDEGLCMAMHQPWASLLVCGVKIHEGRNWYTKHRGRLWIAAASKVPTEEEIKGTENIYRAIRESVVFPLTYPTSCLLGCVNVVNCLTQEEYQKVYPEGESDSPFVFICDSPQELPIRFPVSSKHKIYKMEPTIHKAAISALQRIAKIKAEKNSQSFVRNS